VVVVFGFFGCIECGVAPHQAGRRRWREGRWLVRYCGLDRHRAAALEPGGAERQ